MAGIRGVSPGVADALPVVIDCNGQLGTGSGTGSLVSGTAKIGSTDGAVEILAGNQVAIRIQPPSTYAHGPNISLGSLLNVAGGLAVQAATVGGGGGNTGDTQNSATASYSTIAGGGGNNASGFAGAIAGGISNSAGSYGAIGGGGNNAASGQYATVGGGNGNVASGNLAIVSGGAFNSALGIASFAAGFRAKAVNNGCFAWADNTNADFSCTTNNAFTARAAGGVYLYTSANLATGCQIPAGGGAWSCTSSRETKTDFTTMNPIDVLTRVASLQMTQWRYRTEVSGARHVGPMAEDFHAAFGLGDSTKTINVMDASGIALAAIQGLHQMVKDKNREIDTLKRDLAAIKKKLGLD